MNKYYSIEKRNWVDTSLRQFGKMYESEFQEYLSQQKMMSESRTFDVFEIESPFSGGNMLEKNVAIENHMIFESTDGSYDWVTRKWVTNADSRPPNADAN